ncbi:MAG: glutathione-disulfide reductase [Rhodospirillales bacterium]|nr:glutathione-disulfide reductase [Rhodospirillales bacterium]
MADFDLLVIGGGSGGVACARRAARYSARAAVIENDRLGGTCVHRGCIPKKMLVYASHFSHDFEDAAGYGWTVGSRSFDWPTMVRAKSMELDRLEGIYQRLLRDSGATYVRGTGRLLDAHTVAVGDETHRAETIVIATGGRPTMPAIPGIELAVSSDAMFDLPAFPERVVIVGGGYIACEFACIMQGLGSSVTQLYRRDLPLRGFDWDVREVLSDEMRKGGVDLRLNVNATSLDRKGSAIAVTTTAGEEIETDLVLFATGRKPHVAGLGLESAGVETAENGAIPVDAASHTGVAGIYAIGDVTDRINLTPVAIHEGRCIAETLYNDNPQNPDHRDVATAVFTTPELGTVGLTEEEARQAFPAVDIYKTRFRPLKHTLTGREETIFMKLIADRTTDCVVGCHMVGDGAGEAVQLLGIAVKAGATKAQFDATMAVHPTAAEEFVTMYEPVPESAAQTAQA